MNDALKASYALSRQIRKKERIAEIDFLRGLAVFLMILDHFRYDVSYLPTLIYEIGGQNVYEVVRAWSAFSSFCRGMDGQAWYIGLHVFFVGVFFFVSGISATLSKSHWKRSLELTALAYTLTAVLFVVSRYTKNYSWNIYMGVLNAMAFGHLAYSIKTTFLKSWQSDLWFAGVFLVLTLAFTSPSPSYIGGDPLSVLPRYGEMILGRGAGGLDYIRPLPGACLLFLGSAVGKLIYKDRKSYIPALKYAQPLTFFGQKSLWVYVIHQPVIILALYIAVSCMGYVPAL